MHVSAVIYPILANAFFGHSEVVYTYPKNRVQQLDKLDKRMKVSQILHYLIQMQEMCGQSA